MKLKNTIWIFVMILLATSVLAYPITIRINSNLPDFYTTVYKCSNYDCDSISDPTTSNTGTATNQYTITGSGDQTFAEYDYKAGYLPLKYAMDFTDSTGNGPWDYNINFVKASNCRAAINSVTLSDTTITQNNPVTITANVQSAFTAASTGPSTVPTALRVPYYSANTNVQLIVLDSSSAQVYTQTQNTDIFWSSNNNVAFTWTPTSADTYNIGVYTTVPDTTCSNTLTESNTANNLVVTGTSTSNTAPVISGITDQTIDEDSGLNDNIIDLWNYASDAETADSGLTFTIISETNTAIVDCAVDSNRYIDCTTQTNQYGISDVIVQVSDGSLTDTDTFIVTVSSVNDVPTVTISNPSDGAEFDEEGDEITFTGSATDIEDGSLTGSSLVWSSDKDGNLGNGITLTMDSEDLDKGTHIITLTATDSNGGVGTATIDIQIGEDDEGHDIEIKYFNIPSTMNCGEILTAEIEIKNIGEYKEDIKVVLDIPKLNIDETKTFSLSKSKTETVRIDLRIPNSVESGSYLVKAIVYYNDDDNRESKSEYVTINCGDTTGTETEPIVEVIQGSSGISEKKAEIDLAPTITLSLAILVVIALIVFLVKRIVNERF